MASSTTKMQNARSILAEVDTRALRELVQAPFPVAILGREKADRLWLANALRTDPVTGELAHLSRQVKLCEPPLDKADRLWGERAKLVLVAIAAGREDVRAEAQAIEDLWEAKPHLPIVVVQIRPGANQELYAPLLNVWQGAQEFIVDPDAETPLDAAFVASLRTAAPGEEIALGYHFPALRPALANQIIRQTSMTNAGYSAATGLAELAPMLLIPGNVADFFVLTKNQAMMAYKIALLMGNDVGIQEMIGELSGVLGGGFLWRETARRLVGFLPGWGLAPKVTVAYAGTYIIGEAAYYWYAYHKQMTPEQLRALYARAVAEGRRKAALAAGKMNRKKRSASPPAPRKKFPLPKLQFRKNARNS